MSNIVFASRRATPGFGLSCLSVEVHPGRTPLTGEQINLVREVVNQRAPNLLGVVDKVAERQVIPDAEIDELFTVVAHVMAEETDRWGRYNERGLALDDLLGFLPQWSEGYFDE